MNICYNELNHNVNLNIILRQIKVVEFNLDSNFRNKTTEFESKNIIDNMSLLDEETVLQVYIIMKMGHCVFK